MCHQRKTNPKRWAPGHLRDRGRSVILLSLTTSTCLPCTQQNTWSNSECCAGNTHTTHPKTRLEVKLASQSRSRAAKCHDPHLPCHFLIQVTYTDSVPGSGDKVVTTSPTSWIHLPKEGDGHIEADIIGGQGWNGGTQNGLLTCPGGLKKGVLGDKIS